MPRDFKKESEWLKKVYKRYEFRAKIHDGEKDMLEEVLKDTNFPNWVRKHLEEDYNNI